MSVRVRFAPSPTGYLHVGGARTALFNYLYAKKMGGEFILRIEDTDLERSTDESLRMQIDDLVWLGLKWNEGVNPQTLKPEGEYAPYRQSQRLSIYQEHAEELLSKGMAYYDFRTDEELEALKEKSIKEDGNYHIPRPDNIPSVEEAKARLAKGESAAVRFKVNEGREYELQDLVRGEVKFPSEMVSDFIIMRSNGMPVYNFCCVVDDALMKITHVFRAEEHLNNTLRQQMLYEAFGYPCPEFAHLSLVLGQDKQKLSKRHGATSCHEFMERGFLPEALLNYIALLGWSPKDDREIFSMKELIQAFDVERLNPSGAVFDEEKLKWVNAEHLRAMDHGELWTLVAPQLQKNNIQVPKDSAWCDRALGLFKTYMTTINDSVELFRPIDEKSFVIQDDAKETLSWESSKQVLEAWKAEVSAGPDYLTSEEFEAIQNKIKTDCGVKGKFLFMPIRVAVIGKPHGAELKVLVPLIHKQSLINRVDTCVSTM